MFVRCHACDVRDRPDSMAGRLSSVLACTSRRALGYRQINLIHTRAYATHNETASSLLSQQLERGRGRDAPSSAGPSSVGPFPLGVQPLGLRSARKPAVKPWDQLTPGGKGTNTPSLHRHRLTPFIAVLRTTARASNLTVILIGATLSVVLTYALATELFAKNSPTVLYGDACDRIKDSEEASVHAYTICFFFQSTDICCRIDVGEIILARDVIIPHYPSFPRPNQAP